MKDRGPLPSFHPDAVQREVEALRVRRRRTHHSRGLTATLNLPAMIDLTFLFLIFFLVTTTFERAEGLLASDLPKAGGRSEVALPMTPIVVRLAPGERDPESVSIRVDRVAVHPTDFSALTELLRDLQTQPGFDNETPVVIVADDEVRWDHVVGCWNAALRANCNAIAFAEP